jgi:hypothetical protein
MPLRDVGGKDFIFLYIVKILSTTGFFTLLSIFYKKRKFLPQNVSLFQEFYIRQRFRNYALISRNFLVHFFSKIRYQTPLEIQLIKAVCTYVRIPKYKNNSNSDYLPFSSKCTLATSWWWASSTLLWAQ